MKKSLILSTGVVSLAAAGLMLAPSFVQAQGNNGSNNSAGNGNSYGYQQSLTTKAKVLGMTTEQLQAQLKTKTMLQIAKDKGLSQDQLQQKIRQAAETRWKERGLSQSEINARKAVQAERQANCDDIGGGTHQYHGNN